MNPSRFPGELFFSFMNCICCPEDTPCPSIAEEVAQVIYDYGNLLESIQHGVYFVSRECRITYWNKAAEEITGFISEEVVGSFCSDNILVHVDRDGRNLCTGYCPLAAAMNESAPDEMVVYLRHKDGHRLPVRVQAIPLRSTEGEIVGAAEFFSDVTSTSAMEMRMAELEELALIDPLSRLANRHRIESELEARFNEKNRYGLAFGLLFMDIDKFKQFNDNYGHQTGDKMIRTIAATITSISRPFDLLGRWGGDEILAIIRNVNLDLLVDIGERYRKLINHSCVRLEDVILCPTVSIGATLARKEDTPEVLIARADEMMFKSKKYGGDHLTFDRSSG
jgi:diguanylate cyclase (GGDEF)-like protein/PAS domain S-box-containing protein